MNGAKCHYKEVTGRKTWLSPAIYELFGSVSIFNLLHIDGAGKKLQLEPVKCSVEFPAAVPTQHESEESAHLSGPWEEELRPRPEAV
jgi:hypothetical protein